MNTPRANLTSKVSLGSVIRWVLLDKSRASVAVRYLGAAQRIHGDIFRIPSGFGGERLVVINPDAAYHILSTNMTNYGKQTSEYQMVRSVLGQGLITSDGDLWSRQQRLLAPEFRPKIVKSYVPAMVDEIAKTLDELESDLRKSSYINLEEFTLALTLRILCRCIFGIESSAISKEIADSLTDILNALSGITHPFFFKVPIKKNRACRKAVKRLDEVVLDLIGQVRDNRDDFEHTIISKLLRVQESETGKTMSSAQLRDEVVTFLLAGHETTGVALSWCLSLLSRHPEVCQMARKEIDAILLGEGREGLDAVFSSELLENIIKETLRLYPPIWGVTRGPAKEADSMCGFDIEAGTVAFVIPFFIHRHPDYWSNPDAFDPFRFTSERAEPSHKHAYLPFLVGPRRCLGELFATLEMKLFLFAFLKKFNFQLAPGSSITPQMGTTLRSEGGMWLSLQSRGQ